MGFADSSSSPWFASGTVTSAEARHALSATFSKSPTSAVQGEAGVIPASSSPFGLASNGTAGLPSVAVAPGQCVVVNSVGGTYVCTLPASVTVFIDTPLPSGGNTRRDVLCARVLDSEAGDGGGLTGRLRLETVTGTAAISPTTPSVPSGWLPLFVITVNSSGGLTFSDVRSYTRGVGGVRFCRAGDTRAGSHVGDLRVFETGQIDAWLSGSWITIVAPTVWSQANVNYTYAGNGGSTPQGTVGFGTGGSSFVRYKRNGNDLSISYAARWGTQGTYNGGVGDITTVLPNGWVTPSGRDQWIPCQIWVNNSAASIDVAGMALIQAGSNIVRPHFPIAGPIDPYRIASQVGVAGASVPRITGGFAEGGAIHIGPATIEIAS